MTEHILLNRFRTPDGTIMTSHFRHDFKMYEDVNGKQYMIDGGKDYIRRSANGDEEDLTVYLTDDHEKNREAFHWGTYGPDGDEPLKWITLASITDDHLKNIIKHSSFDVITHPVSGRLFQQELEYREDMKKLEGNSLQIEAP